MKKFVVLILFAILGSPAFALQGGIAPYGVSARFAGMGGAGAALVDDISSAYYNPAGIVSTGFFGTSTNAGAATQGMNELIMLLSNSDNPAKFFSDNFSKALDINGTLSGLSGINSGKFGISIMPAGSLSLKKDANVINGGTLNAMLNYDIAGTFGYSIPIPYIPMTSSAIGANVKSANSIRITTNVESPIKSTSTVKTYSGMGYDVGLKGSLDTPIMPVFIGIVVRDIGETLSGSQKTITTNYNLDGSIKDENEIQATIPGMTIPTTTVIGIAAKVSLGALGMMSQIPTDFKVAADMDFVGGSSPYSVTHMGMELPVFFGIGSLRGGIISGGPASSPIAITTYGIGLPGINFASIMDSKNSKNNSIVVDLGMGF